MSISCRRFFIVGGQRCGTSALSAYLRNHPGICFSTPKEPHYFADDLPGVRVAESESDYQKLFRDCADDNKVFGEGSTGYLQSSCAVSNIYQYDPQSRIIVMLRNPVDMLYSLHAHLLFRGFEEERDFLKAWGLQAARAKGENLPSDHSLHPVLQYGQVGRFGDQVEKLLSIFPRDQVLFILFDEFIQAPDATYESVLRFLDLESDHRTNFEKVNDNRVLRFERLAYLWRKVVPWSVKKKVRGTIFRNRYSRYAFNKFLVVKKHRNKLPGATRKMLTQEFADDIRKLERLTGFSLEQWKS